MSKHVQRSFCFFLCLLFFGQLIAQKTTVTDSTSGKDSVTVIAGKQYARSGLHNFLWGKEWRNAWTEPVRVKVLNMDTAYGGLTPTKKGGGKQTKNLRLASGTGREYAIRSVDKNYGKSIPEEYQGTFLQKIVDDQMSSSFPYAGLVVKKLSAAAHIYSTAPSLYFVPSTPRLDSFNAEYSNYLYSFEDRPGTPNAKYYGAQETADAAELFEALQKHPYHSIDQEAYVKARLFDLMIADWDRHFDQWVWAKKDSGGNVVYSPLPKDRDQAMASYDGLLLRMLTKAAQLSMLQPFNKDLKDAEGFTWVYRNFDAPLTNRVSHDTWLAKARELKAEMTDAVIDDAVKGLPREIYAIEGMRITDVLKSRRDKLEAFADAMYTSLAKDVVILGSEHKDKIEIVNEADNRLSVNVYRAEENKPYYSRSFDAAETKEIRIYGMKGEDVYTTIGTKNNSIALHMIGGPDQDHYDVSGKRMTIYDDTENEIKGSSAKLHVTRDTMLYKFDGKPLKRDAFKIKPVIGYTNEDRLYAGLGLSAVNHSFMDEPFTSKNDVYARYSFTQKAFSFGYKGMFRNVIRHIDLGLTAEYDQVRDQDFLGVGNNTVKSTAERQYYRYRNKEANVGIQLTGNISQHQTLTVSGGYQMVQLYNDAGKYISLSYLPSHIQLLKAQNYLTAGAAYDLSALKNKVLPEGGVRLHAAFDHAMNTDNKKIVNRVSAVGGFIVPMGAVSFSSKIGASKLWGEPEFYQLNKLGGGNSLRGFLRFRLYGTSAVYNQNELQWTFPVKSYLMNGKIGLIGLFDNGRVWMPGEKSDKWYYAFGGGIMIAPFNKISATVTYAVSDEDRRVSLRMGNLLSR